MQRPNFCGTFVEMGMGHFLLQARCDHRFWSFFEGFRASHSLLFVGGWPSEPDFIPLIITFQNGEPSNRYCTRVSLLLSVNSTGRSLIWFNLKDFLPSLLSVLTKVKKMSNHLWLVNYLNSPCLFVKSQFLMFPAQIPWLLCGWNPQKDTPFYVRYKRMVVRSCFRHHFQVSNLNMYSRLLEHHIWGRSWGYNL